MFFAAGTRTLAGTAPLSAVPAAFSLAAFSLAAFSLAAFSTAVDAPAAAAGMFLGAARFTSRTRR